MLQAESGLPPARRWARACLAGCRELPHNTGVHADSTVLLTDKEPAMNSRFPALPGVVSRVAVGLALLLAVSAPTAALERAGYTLEILVDGVPLHEYATRGKNYIEAIEGREYSIRLNNRTGRRIAVALSVDGLNTIDAKTTTADDATKWILGPHQTITLEGWQTGASTARRFFFTTEENSYGAWIGDTRNLGIVSAAVFRERPRPTPIYRHDAKEKRSEAQGDSGGRGSSAPSAPPAEMRRLSQSAESGSRSSADAAPEPSDDFAATGIGRKFDHKVRRVEFESEASPAAVMELRYEYHEALVRLGIRPWHHAHFEDPLARRERARGFEGMEFAPDPFDPSHR